MIARFLALCFDANDPRALARFWAEVLGRETAEGPYGVVLLPGDDAGFSIRFTASPTPKVGRNWTHFDLTSASLENQQATVARALALGAVHLDIGQRPDVKHVVLADPEGNEFCVIEPDNNFLAGCGRLGALAGDGSQEVGYFWQRILDWPLVWDQDRETAVQAPRGGTKITWGGEPVAPKTGRRRLRFDLAPGADLDQEAAIERLLTSGATRTGAAPGLGGEVELADPDGGEFCVWPA